MPDDDSAISGEVVDTTYDGPGEWLPAAAAALRLGVSERTLWRYVDAKQYRRRLVGKRAEVWVPMAGAVPDTPVGAMVAPDADRQMSVAIIEELRRQHEDAVERLTRQAEEIGALKAQAQAAAELAAEIGTQRDDLAAEVKRLRGRRWWQWW